ncbi:hypothetical protein GCM10010201_28150 [Pilimelia columellifera subsp. columellifera]|uniref:Uncharacterized protein n=1 Tax=Pilimelia columellifera subsp. columellifera TaxID=706583 RepID=A0ABN3NNS0_9ACTN
MLGKYIADLRVGHRSKLLDERIKVASRFLDAVHAYNDAVEESRKARVVITIYGALGDEGKIEEAKEDAEDRRQNTDRTYDQAS